MKNQRMKTKARSFGFSAIAIVALMLATLICSFTVMASAAGSELTIAKDDLVFEGLTQTSTGIYTKEYDGTTDVTVSLTDAAKAKLPEGVTVTPKAVFNSKDVQGASVITVSFTLSGANAENYVAPRALTVPAAITPRVLTWNGNGTAAATYKIGESSYTGMEVTLPTLNTANVVVVDGTPEAVAAVQGTYFAEINGVTKAGAYTTAVNVALDNDNYAVAPLTVDVTINKIVIEGAIEWDQTTYEFVWGDDAIYTIVAYGYDANQNAYELLISFPAGYGNVTEAGHLITATLPDPDNMEFAQDNVTNTQKKVLISKLQIEVGMEDATHVLNDGESNPPTFNMVVLGDIPADIRALIAYTCNGEAFNGVTACGAYAVTATLPSSENYEFVANGEVVTTLTANLYVNKQYVHAGSDGNEGYDVILVGQNGFAGDAELTVTIPEKLARKAIKGFRFYKAYTVSVTGAADQTFAALIPISDYLYQNDCEDLTVGDIYVYEEATGTMVKASEKTGYKVTLENGYYRVEGVSGNGSVTFVIAPVYNAPFFLTALGITLLVLLALILLILLPLLVGLYLNKVRRTAKNEAMVIDEGEVPEVEPVVLEDNTDADALLEGTADAIADSIDVDAANDEANTEGVEEAVAESMQEMLDEAAAIELDEEPVAEVADAAEELADAKAEELTDSVDAEAAEAEADEDALRAAVAAAMAENFNESADAEDAVAVAVVEETEDEMTPEEFKAVVDAIVSDAMLRTMDIPELPEEEATEEAVEEATEEVVEEATEEAAEEVVEEATEEAAEEVVEEATEEAAEEVVEEATEEVAEETAEEAVEEEAEEATVCAIVADSVAEAFELITVDGVVPGAVEGTTYETITDAVKDAADANVPETWTEELTGEVVAAVTEELAARLLAVVVEEAVETFASVEDEDDDKDDDDEDDNSFGGFAGMDLEFIDVMAEPEKYAEMLEQESRGEVQLVTRYRRSFQSRLIQSQGNVQEYYNVLKNALLSYKGVKNRISWNYEAFNRGRVHVAKMNAKTKTLYLYLALDPEELADTKYGIVDVSSKKKYATVPVLMKIKGDRKFKYALELIAKLCGENLELPKLEVEDVDYRAPYQTTEELVQAGVIKKLVASVPLTVYGAQSTEEAPVENTPSAATEAQEVTFIAPTTAPAVEEAAEEIPADAPASEDEPKEV